MEWNQLHFYHETHKQEEATKKTTGVFLGCLLETGRNSWAAVTPKAH